MRPLIGFIVIAAVVAIVFLSNFTARDRFQPDPPNRLTLSGGAQSQHPVAVNTALVGSYPSKTHSGAGYFYDDVLEYRVWIDPHSGGERLNAGSDYFKAFATYEEALKFSRSTKGAEPPLVLVRQLEHVNEPRDGVFEHAKGERITEWRVEWLSGAKRGPTSIADFIAKHKEGK